LATCVSIRYSVLTLTPGKLQDSYQLFLPEASAYGQLKLIEANGVQAYLDTAAPRCLANIQANA